MDFIRRVVRKASFYYPFRSLKSQKGITLERIIDSGVNVSQVVDVGVRECTEDLLRLFSGVQHLLFEPALEFHELIRKNYANIDYSLYPDALSDTCASAYLVKTSLEGDGIISHTRISRDGKALAGENVVAVDVIDVKTLDSFIGYVKPDCLLKIDVDGMELPIINGAKNVLMKAAIVVLETTSLTLSERVAAVEASGFRLIDIVDRVRYGISLHQCDIVFVRNDLVSEYIVPSMSPFDSRQWLPLP